jgi:hypothetical protein
MGVSFEINSRINMSVIFHTKRMHEHILKRTIRPYKLQFNLRVLNSSSMKMAAIFNFRLESFPNSI